MPTQMQIELWATRALRYIQANWEEGSWPSLDELRDSIADLHEDTNELHPIKQDDSGGHITGVLELGGYL